ncbi:MAG TPA: hypothetical protein VFQ53_38030 [Kofleriaceae bacterium]|nr:hypothetical protein [Kofleriaceae bacterium]
MKPLLLALGAVLASCTSGSDAPDLGGLEDQIAVVGEELRIELAATDGDGDRLVYGFRAVDLKDLGDRAMISSTPDGGGVFRWTPIASDLGEHAIDFTVSDGDTQTTTTITINVVNSITSPIFRAPLGTGTTLDLDVQDCLDLDVQIEDSDTTNVTLSQGDPVLDGAALDQTSAQAGKWHWCPDAAQRQISRHMLLLVADDGQNPPVTKNYIVVLRGGSVQNPACTDDGAEDDDSPAQARPTTFPSYASTSNVVCENDDDWYAVPLFTGEKMTVDLTFTQANAQQDLDLHLFKNGVDLTPCSVDDPSTCSIANGQSADSNEHTVFTAPAGCESGCDYFVVVRGYDGSSAPYAISIEIQ